MLIVVAPGQGSQTPGMLTPWLEHAAFADTISVASEFAKLDLKSHGLESDADTIRDTAVAQPLIVAAGLGSLACLSDILGSHLTNADVAAGHSVGEITTAAATGILSIEDAMTLVGIRARAMAIAAAAESTGMAAVLGGTREDVIETLTRHGLTAANENGANQIVAAGTLAQLAALSEEPPTGAKVRPLQVAGAFHTHFMASAKQAVADAAASMSISDPSITLVSNRGGDVVRSGQDFVDRLVAQVSSPVRWDLCMETFVAQGVTGIIELFPGGTLTAIAKRAIPGVELLAIKSPEDLEKVAAFTQSHAGRVSSDSSNQSEDTNA